MGRFGDMFKSKIKSGAKNLGNQIKAGAKAGYGNVQANIKHRLAEKKEERDLYNREYRKAKLNEIKKTARIKASQIGAKARANAKSSVKKKSFDEKMRDFDKKFDKLL